MIGWFYSLFCKKLHTKLYTLSENAKIEYEKVENACEAEIPLVE